MPEANVSAEEAGAAIGHNAPDMSKAKEFIERIESVQGEINDIMAEAKARCEPKREDIKAIKKEAADTGIQRRPFNAVLAVRKAEAKAESIRANLDEDHQTFFDNLRHALGDLADLPLGQAALKVV